MGCLACFWRSGRCGNAVFDLFLHAQPLLNMCRRTCPCMCVCVHLISQNDRWMLRLLGVCCGVEKCNGHKKQVAIKEEKLLRREWVNCRRVTYRPVQSPSTPEGVPVENTAAGAAFVGRSCEFRNAEADLHMCTDVTL